jgi:hypothetical protein
MHQSLTNTSLPTQHKGVGEGGREKDNDTPPARFAPRVERFLSILAEIERTPVNHQPTPETQ